MEERLHQRLMPTERMAPSLPHHREPSVPLVRKPYSSVLGKQIYRLVLSEKETREKGDRGVELVTEKTNL